MLRAAARLCVFLCLLAGAGAGAAAGEPRFALLIGNQAYKDAVGPLKNPKNDIALVKAALLKVGFAEPDITVISDADRVAMLEAFEAFAARVARAGPDAVSFFYYSGHGAASEQRDNYLIPVDVPELSAAGFWHRSVKLRELIDQLTAQAPGAKHFVIFDACRNTLKLKDPATKALAQPKGFHPVEKVPGGMLIAFATAEGELASDAGEAAGPYARVLAEEIVKPGVEAMQAFRETQLRVMESTGQKPWMQASPIARLYFAGREAPSLAPLAASEAEARAAREWTALDKNSPAMLRTFLTIHGKSSFAPYAQARLEELTQAPVSPPVQTAIVVQKSKPLPVKPAEDRCENGVLVAVAVGKRPCIKPGAGESFKDCPECPEMVVVPAGSFTMGSPESEPESDIGQIPQHKVTIPKPFAAGRFAVTFAEWDACAADGGCGGYKPSDSGWGRGERPVINVNWDDAKAYVKWLSQKMGKEYRLLSEAEREYVTRAGTKTPFWWGSSISTGQANYDGSAEPYKGGGKKGENRKKTLPVRSFQPNPWGLYQVHGNVWEWVEDCWNGSYYNAPADGSVWTAGDCSHRVVRGGSWYNNPGDLSAACRNGYIDPSERNDAFGLRVARTLSP
jgi:formylglycine-generating enzyme required for sulfatase activity